MWWSKGESQASASCGFLGLLSEWCVLPPLQGLALVELAYKETDQWHRVLKIQWEQNVLRESKDISRKNNSPFQSPVKRSVHPLWARI